MYEMKPEYLTNIPLIDEEHQQLFDYANQVYDLLHQEFIADKYDNIADILGKLRDYTKKHFADEEAYMESIQYKRLFSQKIQHNAFIQKLEEWDLESIDGSDNQDETIQEMLNFLTDWLIHHILELDTQIGK
ncbi:MAG: hemerythrin family protein [Lachnospiraceae bacterium]|nr:hemerythrin family protein [Lachnospiraceae bacterium]